MKIARKMTYLASDGKEFATRAAARSHDTNIKRAERLADFFLTRLAPEFAPAIPAFVGALIGDPIEAARQLSARAARRDLRNDQGARKAGCPDEKAIGAPT